ncbi:MAG: sigma-70 family RNA polymerase sigma factor [Anaerolineae bacterium]|nr:sigma-70 family RNA polymerase sigma factor [Anaerolineae bacterium]
MEESDALLVERAKRDPEAFGILYERYVNQIYNYLYYRVGNHHDAEDLTARTFFQALKHIGRYEERGLSFGIYLHRIAHNLASNWHRDHSWQEVIPIEHLETLEDSEEGPQSLVEQQEEREILFRAIRNLSSDHQQVLILRHVEQMDHASIAKIMGRSRGAVKALYHRALVALRKELDQWHKDRQGET